MCKLRCKPPGCVARLRAWKTAPRRGGTTFSQGQQDSTVLRRLLQPPVGQRSRGTAVTAMGNPSGKAQRPRRVQLQPGAGNALGFAFSRVGTELRHPLARSCGVRRGSPRIPNPGVGTSAGKLPIPRERPARPAGWQRRVGGLRGRGCGRAGAQPWKRAEHPPLPAAAPCYSPPSLHQPWPGRGRGGSAGEQLTRRGGSSPRTLPVVKSVCKTPRESGEPGTASGGGDRPSAYSSSPSL